MWYWPRTFSGAADRWTHKTPSGKSVEFKFAPARYDSALGLLQRAAGRETPTGTYLAISGDLDNSRAKIPALPEKCPHCAAVVTWRDHGGSGCGRAVRINRAYVPSLYVLSFVIAGLGGYALGISRDALFWLTLLGGIPVSLALLRFSVRLFPPDLVVEDDYRVVFYDQPTPSEVATQIRPSAPPFAIHPGLSRIRSVSRAPRS